MTYNFFISPYCVVAKVIPAEFVHVPLLHNLILFNSSNLRTA